MKKRLLVIALIAIMLILVACQNRIDLKQPMEKESNGIIKLPEVPQKEEPVKEEVMEEKEEVPEVKVLPVEVQNEFRVTTGDSFTYKSYTIKVKDIQSAGHVVLDVNGETILFTETKSSDIFNNMRLIYVTSNFTKDRTVTFKTEDFALGTDEYLMKYKEKVTTHNETVKLENIQYDDYSNDDAIWVSITSEPNTVLKIREGETQKLGKVKIEAIQVKDGRSTRQFAHVKITPA